MTLCIEYYVTVMIIKLRDNTVMYIPKSCLDDCICIVYQCNSGKLSWGKLTLLFLQYAHAHAHMHTSLNLEFGIYSASCTLQVQVLLRIEHQ